MGLRSPQEMNQVQVKNQPNFRFNAGQAPELDKTFLNTASAGLAAAQEADRKARAAQLDFVKTQADNEAENDVIMANAELSQIEGLNTLDKSVQLRQKLADAFDKRKQKIPEQFHPYVDQIYQQKLTRYNKFAIPYTLGQVNKVKDEADKTFIANAMNEAIEDSGDPIEYNEQALAKVTYALAKRAEKKFGNSPELVKEAISTGISEVHRRSIEQQAVLGRFDKAQEILDKFDAELTPKDRVKAVKLMEQARADLGDKEASDLANAAAIQFPDDLSKQELWLQSAARNDKVNRAAVAFLRSRAGVQKLQKERQLDAAYVKINEARRNGEDPMQHVFALPPGEEREKLFKWYNETRGGQNVLTDFAEFDKLNDRITNAVSAAELPDDLLDSKRHVISPDNMKILESKYDRLKSQENSEFRRVNRLNYKLAQDAFNSFAAQNGLNAKSKKDERGAAQIAYMEEVERLLTINPKISARELNSRVINTLRDRMMKTETKPRTLFGIDIPFTSKEVKSVNPNLAPDTSPKVHSSWYEAIRRADPSLNETQINATIQTLIRNGKDVSAPR